MAEAGSGLSCRIAGAEAAAVVGRSEEAGKSCHGYITGLALVLCRKDYMQCYWLEEADYRNHRNIDLVEALAAKRGRMDCSRD